LAKLVYGEDDVIFISVNTEVQYHNFSNVSSRLCWTIKNKKNIQFDFFTFFHPRCFALLFVCHSFT